MSQEKRYLTFLVYHDDLEVTLCLTVPLGTREKEH